MRAYRLLINGGLIEMKPKSGTFFSLEELQMAVGGYIELIRIDGDRLMIVDEDGIARKKVLNPAATRLAQRPIRGDVMIIPRGMIE